MSTQTVGTLESFDTFDTPRRARRGVTECMTVVAVDGVRDTDGEATFLVSSSSGEMYAVSRTATGSLTCSCPDEEHNLGADERCKHAHRVAFATGETPIPRESIDAVDRVLARRVAAREWGARYALPDEVAADGVEVVTDGGRRVAPDEENAPDADGLTPGERALASIRRDRTDDGRPVDCQCWDADQSLPCWACARDGFDAPNPETPAAE